jgi:hypothetical protein
MGLCTYHYRKCPFTVAMLGKERKRSGVGKINDGFQLFLRQQLKNKQMANRNFIKYDHPI